MRAKLVVGIAAVLTACGGGPPDSAARAAAPVGSARASEAEARPEPTATLVASATVAPSRSLAPSGAAPVCPSAIGASVGAPLTADGVAPPSGAVCGLFIIHFTGLPGLQYSVAFQYPGDAAFRNLFVGTTGPGGTFTTGFQPDQCVYGAYTVRVSSGEVSKQLAFSVAPSGAVDCSSGTPVVLDRVAIGLAVASVRPAPPAVVTETPATPQPTPIPSPLPGYSLPPIPPEVYTCSPPGAHPSAVPFGAYVALIVPGLAPNAVPVTETWTFGGRTILESTDPVHPTDPSGRRCTAMLVRNATFAIPGTYTVTFRTGSLSGSASFEVLPATLPGPTRCDPDTISLTGRGASPTCTFFGLVGGQPVMVNLPSDRFSTTGVRPNTTFADGTISVFIRFFSDTKPGVYPIIVTAGGATRTATITVTP